jgi:hypothetical protein
VLVVWEPILSTDWRPPSTGTMKRIPDTRARQFWDPQHEVASRLGEMIKQKPPEPPPACCVGKGFYWDDAIVYAPHARWEDPPRPEFWNGAVVRVIPDLEKSLNSQP